MKRAFYLLLTFPFLFSCLNDEAQRLAAEKDAKKNEQVFLDISHGWTFTNPPLGPKSKAVISGWNEMHQFTSELLQKPTTSIEAFRKKAKTLSMKVAELNNNVPPQFNRPEIRSRIAVISTKINSINLFVNLQDIPGSKVIALVQDANIELNALYRQMDELIRRSEIRKEEGEEDMIRMLDTSRAIPDAPAPVGVPANPILAH